MVFEFPIAPKTTNRGGSSLIDMWRAGVHGGLMIELRSNATMKSPTLSGVAAKSSGAIEAVAPLGPDMGR